MNNYTKRFNETLEMARTSEYLILDLETTALKNGRIAQIGILDAQGNVLLNALVNPEMAMPQDAYEIHGLSTGLLSTAPTWRLIEPVARSILMGRNVFIYNAQYDVGVIRNHCLTLDIPCNWLDMTNFYCAMNWYAEFNGDWNDHFQSYRWVRLEYAAQRFNLTHEPGHDAINDCWMTRGVIRSMVEALEPAQEEEPPF